MGFIQLEAIAIQVVLAGRPVKILAVYLTQSRPLISADMDAYSGGGLPGLMAGDLGAKHLDWNSRLTTTREKRLRNYADGNSCLIFGPVSPTRNPGNHCATLDVLDIVITRALTSSVALTFCSAL
jgi:hypothetical protein